MIPATMKIRSSPCRWAFATVFAAVVAIVAIVVLVFATSAVASPSSASAPPPVDASAANALYQAATDWPAIETAYRALAAASPETPQFVFRLGVALLEQGRGAEALAAFTKAETLGTPAAQAAIRSASALALLGRLDAAFAEIERAGKAGFALRSFLDNDPRLAKLQEDARWPSAYAAVDKNARPCLYDPRYRELDFWLGTWDVRPNGSNGAPESTPPSTNVVTREFDGCVVHEHWTAAGTGPGFAGESFNIWDATRDAWFQTWVDNSGGLHEYRGRREGNAMVYFGESPAPAGLGLDPKQRVKTRLTFFSENPDRVRQLSERTLDDGQSWQVNYDLIYTRRKAAP